MSKVSEFEKQTEDTNGLVLTLGVYAETNKYVSQEFYQALCLKAKSKITELQAACEMFCSRIKNRKKKTTSGKENEVMAKRKDRFVVGFTGKGQVVYGKDDETKFNPACFVNPLTFWQAVQQLKTLTGDNKVVYELVPVKAKKVRAK
jgi:hypothetical protein